MWPVPSNLVPLLRTLPATFAHELWSVFRNEFTTREESAPDALQRALGAFAEVPVRSVEELVRGQSSPKSKVSLSDVVVMHHTLSNNPLFNRTLPSTQRRAANVAEVFLPLRLIFVPL